MTAATPPHCGVAARGARQCRDPRSRRGCGFGKKDNCPYRGDLTDRQIAVLIYRLRIADRPLLPQPVSLALRRVVPRAEQVPAPLGDANCAFNPWVAVQVAYSSAATKTLL